MLQTVSHRLSCFTLIELMVVVILIGVIAAMVIPELGGSAETVRLDAATRRLSDMMDFCYHSAASSGRVHALLFDQTARCFDVVSEPAAPAAADAGTSASATGGAAPVADGATATDDAAVPAPAPAPTPAADGADGASGATASAGADASTNASVTGGSATAATGVADQAAQLGLVRVPIPGFLDRTLPEGVALSGMETYETDLSTGETEGQFRILFFPDGTTEFAKVELSIASGPRRVLVLNGINGTVSTFDPDRHGEVDMTTLITDEDNPEETATDTDSQSPGDATGDTGAGNARGSQGSMGGPMGGGSSGGNELFGAPGGQ
jgi:prepilin-type N-terminal cleavage/methylation domain-containing protein